MAEEEEKEEEVAVVEAGFGGWVLLALARRRDGRESSYRGSFTWGGGVLSIYHWRACLTKAWLACPHPIINKRLLLVNLFALRPTLSLSLSLSVHLSFSRSSLSIILPLLRLNLFSLRYSSAQRDSVDIVSLTLSLPFLSPVHTDGLTWRSSIELTMK